jgi:gas vesicle protein
VLHLLMSDATNLLGGESHSQEAGLALRGESMSAKGIWIAFGVGVTAGAAVALLYAPQSGAKTRRQLRNGINDGVDYLEDAAVFLKDQAESLSKEAQKTYKRSKGQVTDIVEKASEAVAGAVKSVQSLI